VPETSESAGSPQQERPSGSPRPRPAGAEAVGSGLLDQQARGRRAVTGGIEGGLKDECG